MPFYYGSKARSVPEYLKLRFDEKTRGLNAITFAVMTIFSSGISMYALAKMFHLVLGWNFNNSIILSARDRAGVHLSGRADERDLQRSAAVLPDRAGLLAAGDSGGDARGRMERHSAAAARCHDAHLEVRGLAPIRTRWAWKRSGWWPGLGFVLSFGYWCTDFLVIQRAMAANSMSARAAHAADRRVSEDADAVHRDPAGHCGAGADEDGLGLFAAAERAAATITIRR